MDRKTLWLWIGVLTILALVGCGSEGYGYPALLGMTGGGQTPSPQVVPPGQYDLAVDYSTLKSDDVDIKTWPIRVVYGASEKAELGIAYTSLDPDEGETGRITDVGAKYLVYQEPESAYSLAVGANYSDFGGSLEGNETRAYAVLGKDLTPEPDIYGAAAATRTSAYVGLMYTRVDNSTSESSTRPFVGLEFIGQSGGSLVLEWKDEKFGDDVTSAILRYPFNPTLMGQVGVTKNFAGFGDMLSDSHRVFVGLNYRFGAPEEETWEW